MSLRTVLRWGLVLRALGVFKATQFVWPVVYTVPLFGLAIIIDETQGRVRPQRQ
jgi:hypothetical protein